jgi:hypothetical protein
VTIYDYTSYIGQCNIVLNKFNQSKISECHDDPTTAMVIESCYGYPISHACVNSSSLVYDSNGVVSIMKTFQLCLENIGGDGPLFPGYSTGGQVAVEVDVSLDNLIRIDEVTNTVSLDFFLNLEWYDYRIFMPALFAVLGQSAIDITPAMNMQNIFGAETGFWLPDVLFPGNFSLKSSYPLIYYNHLLADAEFIEVSNQFVRLINDGEVSYLLWS